MKVWTSDQLLDEKVIALVNQGRVQYDIPETCSGDEACRKVGLKLSRGRLPIGTDGLLCGDQVIVNQQLSWAPRVDFTIFHEITHHLLNEDGEHYEYFTSALRKNESAFKSAIERYCDRGAAEFLMPRHLVRAAIAERGFSVELIEHLASHFGASIVASAIQLASCAPIECYVLLCAFGLRPRSNPPQRTLFAEYVAAPRCTRYALARFCAIPRDHLCYQVWQDQVASKGRSFVPFPSGKRMPCDAEARYLEHGRVAAILSLGQLASPGQLSLGLTDSEA